MTAEIDEELEDRLILSNTISTRQQITNLLFKDNTLPDNDADRKLLLTNLSALESVALTRRRLRGDKEAAGQAANVQAIIAKALLQSSISMTGPRDQGNHTELPNDFERPTTVPGELDINPLPLDPAKILNEE